MNETSDIAVKQLAKITSYVGGWHGDGVVTYNCDIA
jgi:hypothetical protein